MAINIYDYRETRYYAGYPGKGNDAWGWYITTNAAEDDFSFAPFGSRELMTHVMKELKEKIKKLPNLVFEKADDHVLEAAAVLVMSFASGTLDQHEWTLDVLSVLMEKAQYDALLDATDDLSDWVETQDVIGDNTSVIQ